jgi:hypothetical protein
MRGFGAASPCLQSMTPDRRFDGNTQGDIFMPRIFLLSTLLAGIAFAAVTTAASAKPMSNPKICGPGGLDPNGPICRGGGGSGGGAGGHHVTPGGVIVFNGDRIYGSRPCRKCN